MAVVYAHGFRCHFMIPNRPDRTAGSAVDEIPGNEEHHNGDAQRKEVKPLVRIEPDPERCFGLHKHDAAHSASPTFQMLVLQELWRYDPQREGGKRQVQALQLESWAAKGIADGQANHGCSWQGEPVSHASLVHHDRNRVRTDSKKGAVA